MTDANRPAAVSDVHALAAGMPHAKAEDGHHGKVSYQVGRKSFVIFRNPRPDAVDPDTGERYDDVICIRVPSEDDKLSLVQDDSPFFTTDHFNGYNYVLVRAAHLHLLTYGELAEVVQDAWLCQASPRRAKDWLASRT